jgi:hypothetical protein
MGNLGRAGYGASLEGMVCYVVVFGMSKLIQYGSGRIRMIHAMWEHFPTRPILGLALR